MNIKAKILNKMYANRIQQYVETIMHHDRVGVIPSLVQYLNTSPCSLVY